MAARRIAEKHLQKCPDSDQALDLLIDCLNRQGAHREALERALAWREREPLSPAAQVNVAHGYLHLRKKKDARAAIDDFRASFPFLADSADSLDGKYALVFDQHERARQAFEARAKAQPDDLDAKLGLMLAAFGAERMWRAARLGREIVASDPDNGVALRHLAFAELCLMRFKSARTHALAALRIDATAASMREVVWASRAALFPPFLFGHMALSVAVLATGAFRSWIVGVAAAVSFFWLFDELFKSAMEAVNLFGIPGFAQGCYWLALGWLLWLSVFPKLAGIRAKRKSKAVTLKGY